MLHFLVGYLCNLGIIILFYYSGVNYFSDDLFWGSISFVILNYIICLGYCTWHRFDVENACSFSTNLSIAGQIIVGLLFAPFLPASYYIIADYYQDSDNSVAENFQRRKYNFVNNYQFNVLKNEAFQSAFLKVLSIAYFLPQSYVFFVCCLLFAFCVLVFVKKIWFAFC